MKTVIELERVTACGCTNSIHHGLGELRGVFGVRVDAQNDRILIEHTDEVGVSELKARLREMGYRERFPKREIAPSSCCNVLGGEEQEARLK